MNIWAIQKSEKFFIFVFPLRVAHSRWRSSRGRRGGIARAWFNWLQGCWRRKYSWAWRSWGMWFFHWRPGGKSFTVTTFTYHRIVLLFFPLVTVYSSTVYFVKLVNKHAVEYAIDWHHVSHMLSLCCYPKCVNKPLIFKKLTALTFCPSYAIWRLSVAHWW